jgi:PAS domain S-box-containing protein/putative nucleotidyltransferase with HDIG domain
MQNSQSQARLLIVEDSIVQAEMLQRILVGNGYAVDIARNGAEGLAKIKASRPALVISDIVMPEMSGFELCRQIRAEEKLQDLPVILVTVLSELEDVLEGLASGADNFVTKPYSEPRLISIVREQLAKRKLSVQDQAKNGLLVTCGGQKYSIRETSKKILDFFLSSYGIALEKNVELIQTQRELQELNDKLEQEVQQRALALIEEASQRQEAEEELGRTRRHQELILNAAGEGILGVDLKGRITFANPAGVKMLGYEQEDILGQPFVRVCPLSRPDGSPVPEQERAFYVTLRDGQTRRAEGIYRRHDGTGFPIRGISTPIIEGEQITGAVITFWDITERKRAEEALRQSEKELSIRNRIAQVFLTIPDDEMYGEVLQIILEATDSKGGVFGYLDEEGTSVAPSMSREVWDQCQVPEKTIRFPRETWGDSIWGRAILQKKSLYSNQPGKVPQGHLPINCVLATPLIFRGEVIGHFEVANKDTGYGEQDKEWLETIADFIAPILTARLHRDREEKARQGAEQGLIDAAQKWRMTFDAIGDAVCLMDSEAKILTCNQAMADLVKRPFLEIIGRHCWEVVHGTTGPIDGCPLVRMKKSGKRETLTHPLGDRWFQAVVDPILNEAGEVTGAVYIIADITDYQQATQKIRDLNTLLKAIKAINEALLRVESETDLFQQTCDLLLGVPYVRFTWIGLVQPDSFEFTPVAWAGAEEGYLSVVKVAWDDSPFSRGPTGEAFWTGQPFVRSNIETDPQPNPWREAALQRGYQSSIALPLTHQKEVIGILKVYSGKTDAFGSEETEFLNQVAGDIAVGVKSLRLEQGLEQSVRQLQIMIHQTVETMGNIVETRDRYTAGHQQGVAHLAGAIAAEMGLDADCLQGLRVAGLLHDIGKMLVPAEILSKPGKLKETEFYLIKTHAQVGADILGKIDFPWPVAQTVLQHHERLDGSGYPNGLAAPDIIQEAKILAVADVVEAMASHRPYRPALGIDKALEEISKNKGILYDPEVVDVCVKLFTEKGFRFEALHEHT